VEVIVHQYEARYRHAESFRPVDEERHQHRLALVALQDKAPMGSALRDMVLDIRDDSPSPSWHSGIIQWISGPPRFNAEFHMLPRQDK
jgi:hypothetical protein